MTIPIKTLEVSHIGGVWYLINSLDFAILWLVPIRCEGDAKEARLLSLELYLSKFNFTLCCFVTFKNVIRFFSWPLLSASSPHIIISSAIPVLKSKLLKMVSILYLMTSPATVKPNGSLLNLNCHMEYKMCSRMNWLHQAQFGNCLC